MNTEQVVLKLTKTPVRLSYPNLFEPKSGPDGGKPVFSASFILDKKANGAEIKEIQAAIAKIKTATWGSKPVQLKGVCLRDGAEKNDTDGYGDTVMFISARSERRPGVVDRNLSPLSAEDGKPYAGCYVFATLRLWAQDNKFGKRVNAALRNVQFVKDGTPFGEKPVAAEEEFAELGGEPADAVV